LKDYLKKLNEILSKRDKLFLYALFLFSLLIALIETIGVSIIMPYISLANDLTQIEQNVYYTYVYDYFRFNDPIRFVIIFGVFIVFFYILRAIINASYMYYIMRFTFSRYDIIVNKLFKNYLKMPYKDFVKSNTSVLTKTIINEASYITELFKATLLFASETLVFVFIYSILLYVDYEVILGITILIGVIGLFVFTTISKITKKKGKEREIHQKHFYEILNKNFNNIKMLKLQSLECALSDFSKASKLYTGTVMIRSTIQHFPRLIFEAIGFSIVSLMIIFFLYRYNTDISSHYATLTVFILGLYRLLPSITRIFLNFNSILFYYKSLDLIHSDFNLKQEELGNSVVGFSNTIRLNNIAFSYKEDHKLINNLSLEILKNEKVAFIGESGSGKSTLIDIIMGLHQTTEGSIYIDNTELNDNNLNSWREHFGYIPQSVYLFDGTVAENIAFGLDIDENKVIEVLNKANIWKMLEQKDGLYTKVGEGGVMLSGGQKQRIAIARALYKNPDILVLDEATSALDDETENKIMNEIYDLAENKTLIIIAHRLSTIRRCEKVYEMRNGQLEDVDKF